MHGKVKIVADSQDAYENLKIITDAAQSGELKPWGSSVVELINAYGIAVDRRDGQNVEMTLSFPKNPEVPTMAIGVRHIKPDGSFAEDIFLFEKGVGMKCLYKGAQEKLMPEYAGTHHGSPSVALQEALPTIQNTIAQIQKSTIESEIFNTIDFTLVVREQDHLKALEQISATYKQTIHSFTARGASPEHVSIQLKPEFDKQRREQMMKWGTSQEIYNLKLDQLTQIYPKKGEEYTRSIARLNKIFGKNNQSSDN